MLVNTIQLCSTMCLAPNAMMMEWNGSDMASYHLMPHILAPSAILDRIRMDLIFLEELNKFSELRTAAFCPESKTMLLFFDRIFTFFFVVVV